METRGYPEEVANEWLEKHVNRGEIERLSIIQSSVVGMVSACSDDPGVP
jgi:hypothetical protein